MEVRKYMIGTDDDDLTADMIERLPVIAALADEFTDEFREFTANFYAAAYSAGYMTYAGFYRGTPTEITYLVKA
ncbi:MAG TPA: hypothetical protein VFR24_20190 [Candidatus Angelobacter sp.]|nr:hypothetical protein [Candidatus Angelobacter sp.]